MAPFICRSFRSGRSFAAALALLWACTQTSFGQEVFRDWKAKELQGVKWRLLHWNENHLYLESESRQYALLSKNWLPSDDLDYIDKVAAKASAKVDPNLIRDPIPLIRPDGTYIAPLFPVAYNGRYLFAGNEEGKLFADVYTVRNFAIPTQGELINRFADRLSLEELIFAGGPFRESLWFVDEKRSLREIAPEMKGFCDYPEDTYFVGTDGVHMFFEVRLEGTQKDAASYPSFIYAPWADVAKPEWMPMLRYIHLGFAKNAKANPAGRYSKLVAAHREANRGEPGPFGEPRLWRQSILQSGSSEKPARLILRNAREALILQGDGVVDVVNDLTEEDVDYLTSLDGFWSPRHDRSLTVKYEASKPPVYSRNLSELLRTYSGDETLIAELEAGLVPPEAVESRDRHDFRNERLEVLASVVAEGDAYYAQSDTERIQEELKSEKLTMAKAQKRLAEVQSRRIDPTDGNTPGEKLIENWKRLRPDSPHPAIVTALACRKRAWDLRGNGLGSEVGAKAAEGFGLFLDKCEGELDEAEAKGPQDPVVAYWQLMIGAELGYPRDKMNAIVRRAVTADPEYTAPHVAMVRYLQPQWQGEPGDVGRYMAAVVKRFSGQIIVDAFYQSYTTIAPGDIHILARGEFDPATLAAIAREMAERSDVGSETWRYAEMLCYFGKDAALARDMIEKAGSDRKLVVMSAEGNELFMDPEQHRLAVGFFFSTETRPRKDEALWSFHMGSASKDPNPDFDTVFLDGGERSLTLLGGETGSFVDLDAKKPAGFLTQRGMKLSHVYASSDGAVLVASGRNAKGEYVVQSIDGKGKAGIALQGVVDAGPDSLELLSLDGKLFAKTSRAGESTTFAIWDTTTGKKSAEQTWSHPVDALLFSPDSKSLSVWSGSSLGVFDVATKKFEELSLGDLVRIGRPQLAANGEIAFVVRDRSGPNASLAVASSLRAAASSELSPLAVAADALDSPELRYAVSPRRLFVSGTLPSPGATLGHSPTVDVFDVATGERTHRIRMYRNARALLFRDANEILLCVNDEGVYTLWDVSDAGLAELAKIQAQTASSAPK